MHKHANKKLINQYRSRDREDYFNDNLCFYDDESKRRTKMRQENQQKKMVKKETRRKELDTDDSYFEKVLNFLNKTDINSKSVKKTLKDSEGVLSRESMMQIMKITGTILLLSCCASEALADFDLSAGIKASIKPYYENIKNYWKYGVGLLAIVITIFGEGDLRVRAKNGAFGGLTAAAVILFLFGIMGELPNTTPTTHN